jgi:D-alanyl-D-alanine carboxypeptidase (penicillin-binding protein 5/6)
MKKLKIFTVYVLIAVLFAAFLSPYALAAEDPEIKADAVLLVETVTGKVLYEKNADKPVYPGSISKVMTLLLAVEAVESSQKSIYGKETVTETALSCPQGGVMAQGLQQGEEIRYIDLLYAAFVASSDDACAVLAEAVSGSDQAFTARMNERAGELGCENTTFTDAAGAIEDGQTTTARDQVKILTEALRHPLFVTVAGTAEYDIGVTNLSPERKLVNSNLLLRKDSTYYDSACYAGKTEASVLGGYSYVSAAKVGDLNLVAAVFGAEAVEDANGGVMAESYSETKRLYKWAASGFAWQSVTDSEEAVMDEPVRYGLGIASVGLCPSETVMELLPTDMPDGMVQKSIILYGRDSEGKILAPVKKGDVLGEMTVTIDGREAARVKLLAAVNVEMDREAFFKTEILNALTNRWVMLTTIILTIVVGFYIYLVVMYRRTERENEEWRLEMERMRSEEYERQRELHEQSRHINQ